MKPGRAVPAEPKLRKPSQRARIPASFFAYPDGAAEPADPLRAGPRGGGRGLPGAHARRVGPPHPRVEAAGDGAAAAGPAGGRGGGGRPGTECPGDGGRGGGHPATDTRTLPARGDADGPSPQDAGSWRFSPSRQAVLGPFGELLTEADLQQLERAVESLRLRRRGEAYQGELRRLARELRALLPAPLLSISVRSPPPAPGQPLPLWCGRLAGAVSSLAALLAHAEGARVASPAAVPRRPRRRRAAPGAGGQPGAAGDPAVRGLRPQPPRSLRARVGGGGEEGGRGERGGGRQRLGHQLRGGVFRRRRRRRLPGARAGVGQPEEGADRDALPEPLETVRLRAPPAGRRGPPGGSEDRWRGGRPAWRGRERPSSGFWAAGGTLPPAAPRRRRPPPAALRSPRSSSWRVPGGGPADYENLSLELFMLGYFRILEQELPPEERRGRHLLCFEVFEQLGRHGWRAVRAFHRAVTDEIAAGRRGWQDSFDDIKARYFGSPRSSARRPGEAEGEGEDICRYIDRSFAFWKEKEAEIFSLEE
ncbi:unnamed protein product [Bubo scandiacus]